MKMSLIARAGTALIAFPIIILLQAPTGSASFEDYGSGESPTEASCTDEVSAFPTSIYTQLHTGLKGAISGFEIRLYYADKNCSAILYSSNALDDGTRTKAYQSGNDSVITLR